MRILYISQYFPPEMGAPSARVSELSRYWVEMGHEVTVLTCFPNYPDGVVYQGYDDKIKRLYMREEYSGVEVLRVWAYPTHLRSSLRRGINYMTSLLSYSLAGPMLKNIDIVIATSPPPFVGLTALMLKYLKGIPFVFEVRDLWPEVIAAVGASSPNSLSYKIIDKIVAAAYKKSDCIVALTESFKDSIVNARGINENKVRVIENAVDTELFKPNRADINAFKELGLEDKFIVSYVGTIGLTHGVDVVIDAAEKLKSKIPELVFLLVGDGHEKDRLELLTNTKGLENVLFLGRQDRSKIPEILNASDISLVLSKKSPLLEKTLFAKVFEPMACGIPVIVGAEGETKIIAVEQGNAGISFVPEDARGLIDCIDKLYKDSSLRQKLGENGRKLVLSKYSRQQKAHEYIELLENIVGRKNA
jgi:glycosyltransferase involved in cell wall biosynthesis